MEDYRSLRATVLELALSNYPNQLIKVLEHFKMEIVETNKYPFFILKRR